MNASGTQRPDAHETSRPRPEVLAVLSLVDPVYHGISHSSNRRPTCQHPTPGPSPHATKRQDAPADHRIDANPAETPTVHEVQTSKAPLHLYLHRCKGVPRMSLAFGAESLNAKPQGSSRYRWGIVYPITNRKPRPLVNVTTADAL
jgi:hypothetical protein